jgi:uncharacterized transporter YbjL
MFLVGVRTRAGYPLNSTFAQGNGMSLFVAGAVLTTLTAVRALLMGLD